MEEEKTDRSKTIKMEEYWQKKIECKTLNAEYLRTEDK